jgi:Na+-driven multidrug efflux pump
LSGPPRPDLGIRRLFAVWWPLALTYVLVTGGTPIVNGSINRLPGLLDPTRDLAAFAVFLRCIIILHSPLLVTREIAIRMSADRAGSRRALRFCLAAGALVTALEVALGATALGPMALRLFTDNPDLAARAHRAFLAVSPVPLLVAVRGVYQAHQIRADDTLLVGLGTLLRLVLTAVVGLLVAPHLDISGPMLGALFANLLGVATQYFYLRIAADVPKDIQDASLAAFQEVMSLHFLIGAGALALQPITTAKAHSAADIAPLRRFAVLSGVLLSALCALLAFVAPLRSWVLVDLLKERADGAVVALAMPTLAVAAVHPILSGIRFFLRGVLISRGHTRAITLSNVTILAFLAVAPLLGLLPFPRNGALNAYCIWVVALGLEIAILAYAVRAEREGQAPLPPPVRSPREVSAG